MTPEEAKKYLECIVGDGSMEFVYCPIKTEVLKIAIDAMEYRIPKKPHKVNDVTDEGYSCYEWVCDECGDVTYESTYEFCPNCGHAIDWEDER